MKYWRGYLVALIFAAISLGLVAFAKAHGTLVDMIYPYMTRMFMSSLADWSSGVTFCVWTVIVLMLVVGLLVSVILMIILRWNFAQWLGWVLAAVFGVSMCHTILYGLNEYAGPLADDIHMSVSEYTSDDLYDATVYFRDKALELSSQVSRDEDGDPNFGEFETVSAQAADGFQVLTYDEALPVFAGSTVPVKKLGFTSTSVGITMPLTGESAVKASIDDVALPFAICQEMAKRMCISHEEDAQFAAYLACIANPDVNFQYSAYCMAYYFCYSALENIEIGSAQEYAMKADQGVSERLREDVESCEDVFGKYKEAPEDETDVVDLLTNWHINTFKTEESPQENQNFNPLDPSQVDLTYKAPEVKPLPTTPKK